jgi:hypothetical protein
MQDWEILTLSLVITFFTMLAITWWAKPETDKNIWAREELREREILKLKEYVVSVQFNFICEAFFIFILVLIFLDMKSEDYNHTNRQ